MSRILMVSKFRRFLGGVERHVTELTAELSDRGHDVQLFASEDVAEAGGHVFAAADGGLDRIRSAGALLWNASARRALRDVVADFAPDIVHLHSIYHQLSPSVLGVFDGPTVMTLHDFKLAAPCYSLYRDGEVCMDCVGRRVTTPAIKYRCIRDSRLASTLCTVEDLLFRRRYVAAVNLFIVPSTYSQRVMMTAGIAESSIRVIPWGTDSAGLRFVDRSPNTVLFAGRLHPTKGLLLLLEAWHRLPQDHGLTLRIAGSGELQTLVEEAASADSSVKYLGLMTPDEVQAELQAATIAIAPSLVPETMGLSALEALRAGTPLVTTGRGALVDLVGPGVWTLPAADSESLFDAIDHLMLRGEAGRYRSELAERDLSAYSSRNMVDRIEDVYAEALSNGPRE